MVSLAIRLVMDSRPYPDERQQKIEVSLLEWLAKATNFGRNKNH